MKVLRRISKQLRPFRRHRGIAVAALALATACAIAVCLHLPKEYEATAQLTSLSRSGFPYQAKNATVEAQRLISDHDILVIDRRFHVYPEPLSYLLEPWVIARIRAKLSMASVKSAAPGIGDLSLSFEDRNGETARQVTNTLASFLASSSADVAGSANPANSPTGAPSAAQEARVSTPTSLQRKVREKQESLARALQKDRELQSKLQRTASEWAQMHRELATEPHLRLSSLSIRKLSRQSEQREIEIVALQKSIDKNHTAEKRWKTQLASTVPATVSHEANPYQQGASANVPPTPLRTTSVAPFAISSRASAKLITKPPSLSAILLSSCAFGLIVSLSLVFAIDRLDGSVKEEFDLRNELSASVAYLGEVPRIKHEIIRR